MSSPPDVAIHPLTPERREDFETFMGPKGGVGGCWCMLWRQSKADQDRGAGEANRLAMQGLIGRGPPPGLLAYLADRPIGWVSVAPRRSFVRLANSRVLQPVDDAEVWSVSCLLIARGHRGRGVATGLLTAACDFARAQGARLLEGYPIAPKQARYPAAYAWTGFAEQFLRAGFREVARRSETRPIMRKALG